MDGRGAAAGCSGGAVVIAEGDEGDLDIPAEVSAAELVSRMAERLDPPPPTDLWSWCCDNLVMSDGRSFQPERALVFRRWYRRAQARLLRRPLEGDPAAHRAEVLGLIAASAAAKSTWVHAAILWSMLHAPRRVGLYARRRGDLTETRRGRLLPMLHDTPDLAALLPAGLEARAEALGVGLWTIGLAKLFFRCASVLDDWRQEHYELLALDEVDRYPELLEGVADPLVLADGRSRPYARTRLRLVATTPSRVTRHGWRILCSGSHERLLVECLECRAADWLDPRRVVLVGGDAAAAARPLTAAAPDEIQAQRLARWQCGRCGRLHDAADLRLMVRIAAEADRWCPGTWKQDAMHPDGHWTLAAKIDDAGRLVGPLPPAEGTILTGHLNALYVSAVSLDIFAAETARALRGGERQRETLYSDTWAEPYIAAPEAEVDGEQILAHCSAGLTYRRGFLDRDPTALVLAFDQQGNRADLWWFPWVLIAVGPDGTTWRVDAGRGDARDLGHARARDLSPAEVRDAICDRVWRCGTADRTADVVAIDSANGHFRQAACQWASVDPRRRLLVRGSDSLIGSGVTWEAAPESRRQGRARPTGVREYRFDPHWWRDELHQRITRRPGAPGWFMPADMPEWYSASLFSESPTECERHIRGEGRRMVRIWEPRSTEDQDGKLRTRTDNHWLACEVMALVAIAALGLDSTTPPAPAPEETGTPDRVPDDWLGGLAGKWR